MSAVIEGGFACDADCCRVIRDPDLTPPFGSGVARPMFEVLDFSWSKPMVVTAADFLARDGVLL